MIVVSIMGFVVKMLTFKFVSALIEVYIFVLAIVILILESAGKIPVPRRVGLKIQKFALFLKYVWGRGILFVIGGTLQVSQVSSQYCKSNTKTSLRSNSILI